MVHILALVVVIGGLLLGHAEALAVVAANNHMWGILGTPQPSAWKTVFGEFGQRGEYMDGYTQQAMIQRCIEDYKWNNNNNDINLNADDVLAKERAAMMAHLYDNTQLWKYVNMVAFAEHYIMNRDEDASLDPFEMFQKHKQNQPKDTPIFGGVVLSQWESLNKNSMAEKLAAFRQCGLDYVRLECNFGTVDDILGATQLTENQSYVDRFCQLADVAKQCQEQEMVPLILLQVPWREPGGESIEYFEQAVKSFARALKNANVDSKRLLFETRPPIGLTAQEERALSGSARVRLGLKTGKTMFAAINKAFEGDSIAGFCVAGGSTKGDVPTAMEDDTQNAVRRGIRQSARQHWGYDLCFWEMGAKLMLQPKVGRLWGHSSAGRDAARELFCVNAKDLADEIIADIPP